MSGRHALPKPTVDRALSAAWALGSVATLGLLGVLITDAPAHGAPASVSQPDAEPIESAALPVSRVDIDVQAVAAVHGGPAHTCRCPGGRP